MKLDPTDRRRVAIASVLTFVALPAVWTGARARGLGLADVVGWMSAAPARLAGLVRSGDVSPRELVEASLRRIEALDPQLNAFRKVLAERALAAGATPGEYRAEMPGMHGRAFADPDGHQWEVLHTDPALFGG